MLNLFSWSSEFPKETDSSVPRYTVAISLVCTVIISIAYVQFMPQLKYLVPRSYDREKHFVFFLRTRKTLC